MSKKNKTKTRDTQMFTVTCHVTGTQKRVRKPVFMKRVNRVQSLVRSMTGDRISVPEAQGVLDAHYVSTAGRRQANVDFLGQPMEFALAFKATRKPKSRKKTTPKVVASKSKATKSPIHNTTEKERNSIINRVVGLSDPVAVPSAA